MFTVSRSLALPEGIESMARAAADEGYGMISRLVVDHASGENRFDAPGEGLWELRAGAGLIGVCGLNQDPFAAPVENAGRIRRLYVIPGSRRHGVASALLTHVITAARLRFSLLTAFTTSPAATLFYTARGFQEVSDVPRRSFQLPL